MPSSIPAASGVPGRPLGRTEPTTGLLIGYARVSTEEQDLTAQRDGLATLGVEATRCYVDREDVRVLLPTAV